MSSGAATRSPEREGIDPAVAAILASADVWDMTLPWLPTYWDIDILARYRRAGFTFVSATLQDWPPTFDGTRRVIDEFKALVAAQSNWLAFGSSLAAIAQGKADGKLVIGFNSQETRIIAEDLSLIEPLYALGFGHMVLAYNVRNLVADGCAEPADAGLSNFGRQVVREMNRVGMIVDCSHTGRRSSLEAIELSSQPVIFSHSNVHAICAHIRNIHDEQIRACAATGGVIGVVGVGAFLGDVYARTESMFRHIDYLAAMVGPQHIGLGTDYVSIFPMEAFPQKWQSIRSRRKSWPDPSNAWSDPTGSQIPLGDSHCFRPEQLAELIAMMLAHGYSECEVRGILGGNFRRVYSAVVAQ